MAISPPATMIKDHLGDFNSLEAAWLQLLPRSAASHIFYTPCWGKAWWQNLGNGEPHLLLMHQDNHVVGIAPLLKQGKNLTLLGDKDVCDYLDLIAVPGEESKLAQGLLSFASECSCLLDIYPLLPGSLVLNHLAPLAQQQGYVTHTEVLDISYRLELPTSWEEYLGLLEGKQRHELKRKLRRLERAGQVNFYSSQSFPQDMDDFLHLFRISRSDKAVFMTPQREAFFRQLATELGQKGWLQLYFMEMDKKRIATALCFDYGDTLYLYNSGFNPDYADLSVGLLCKAWSIQEAIHKGKKVYDFLRGAEDYKSQLGGKPTPVYRCTIVTQRGVPTLTVKGLQ